MSAARSDSKDPALRLNSVRGYNRWLSDLRLSCPRTASWASQPSRSTPPERAVRGDPVGRGAARAGQRLHPPLPREGDYGDHEVGPDVGGVRRDRLSGRPSRGRPAPGHPRGQHLRERAPFHDRHADEQADDGRVGVRAHPRPGPAALSPSSSSWRSRARSAGCSFFQYYSDHLWEKHRYWTKSELEEPPSHYFRRQVFATFMEDPVGLRERHHIGIDNIMWASDYPHSETTWPNSKALTDEWFTPYGEEDKHKILWENAPNSTGLPRTEVGRRRWATVDGVA